MQKLIRLEVDAYRLPQVPIRPQNFEERRSLKYLHKLQAENDRQKYPVPDYLNTILRVRNSNMDIEEDRTNNSLSIRVPAQQEIELALEIAPPPSGTRIHNININAYHDTFLAGGITAYIKEDVI
jgi:hypothetical protein